MKVARNLKRKFAVDYDIESEVSPWIITQDMPCGIYATLSSVNEPITHWVDNGFVWEFEEIDIDVKKRTGNDQSLIPECEVVFTISEVDEFDISRFSELQLGALMANKAQKRMEECCNALARAGCKKCFLFIRSRPFIFDSRKDKNFDNSTVIQQFSVCGL